MTSFVDLFLSQYPAINDNQAIIPVKSKGSAFEEIIQSIKQDQGLVDSQNLNLLFTLREIQHKTIRRAMNPIDKLLTKNPGNILHKQKQVMVRRRTTIALTK